MPQPALLTMRYKLLLGGISGRALVSPDLKKKGLGDTLAGIALCFSLPPQLSDWNANICPGGATATL